MAVHIFQMLFLGYENSKDGCFFRQELTLALLADHHVAKGVCVFQFFSPHFSTRILESCLSTCLVSAHIVVLFQFRMVSVSCSSRRANKNVPPKTAPLSTNNGSLHEGIRSCHNLDSKPGAYTASCLLARDFENSQEDKVPLIKCWNAPTF